MGTESRRRKRQADAEKTAQFKEKVRSGEENVDEGISWGPLIMIGLIFGCGLIGFLLTVSDYFGGADSSQPGGYYWCIDQVEAFYRKRNPKKLGDVASLCEKYAGKEARLLEKLRMKYNV